MTNYKLRMREKADALRAKGQARILAVESSCDETAIAIVENGRTVRANAIATQIDVHALYGGVVPEIASRMHVEAIDPLLDAALSEANMTLNDVDAIAVTYGPGLVGALLTGVSWAKALAYARDLPLIPVNHIEGHVSANYVAHPNRSLIRYSSGCCGRRASAHRCSFRNRTRSPDSFRPRMCPKT